MRIFPSEAVGSDCIYSPDLSRYCKWPAGGQRVPIPGILDGLPVYAWKMKENEGFTVGRVLTTIHHHYVQLAKAVMSIVDLCFCPGPAVAVAVAAAVAVGAVVVVVGGGGGGVVVLLLLLLPLQLSSQSRIGRKSSNRSYLRVFGDSRSKKHRKYPCCLCLGRPKPRYLRCVIYSVFWTAPSKNIGICAVFGMLKEVIFPCKVTKPM